MGPTRQRVAAAKRRGERGRAAGWGGLRALAGLLAHAGRRRGKREAGPGRYPFLFLFYSKQVFYFLFLLPNKITQAPANN